MRGRIPYTHLKNAIDQLAQSPTNFSGYCFRCTKAKYGNSRDAFSGEGSNFVPGRFHAKGAFLIVYAASSFNGAQWEFTHTARTNGINIAHLLPVTTLSANVQLSKVLDLTDAAVLQLLGVSLAEIRDAPWNDPAGETLTQVIGRLTYEAGFEALLAPSGSGDTNINLLPANLQAGSILEIINEKDLPPPT